MHAPVLAAEDEETDGFLLQMVFKKTGLFNVLVIVRDGQEAVNYLAGGPPYADRSLHPLPGLLLLDLKMPRIDGFEVLKWVRQQPGLSSLRVVVLTSSEDIRDVNVAYKLGANSFMVKPMDFEDVVHMSQFLSRYWLKLSKAPDTFRQPRHRTSKPENSRNEPDGKHS